jgi:N-acetyl-anhydromuramyl-L-alanine amidase AmpD
MLFGNFDIIEPTSQQIEGTVSLITDLKNTGYSLKNLVAHKDIPNNPTDCPGKKFDVTMMGIVPHFP